MQQRSSQATWIASPTTTSIRPSSAFPTSRSARNRRSHRSFGSEYFIRLSHSSVDLTDQVEEELEHNPGVADGGLVSGEEKPKRRIPLPFLDLVTIPQWKTAPRLERDQFWQRIKDEIFALSDDHYLVDRCLLEPHQLIDTKLKSEFATYKCRLYGIQPNLASNETALATATANRKFFLTQMGEGCTLAGLQHRLRELVTSPMHKGRLNLLKMDCAIVRSEEAVRESIAEEEEKKRIQAEQEETKRGRYRSRATPAAAGSDEKSPSRPASPGKKSSRVASKLQGAIEAGSTDRPRSPGKKNRNLYLQSEEERADLAEVARFDKESALRLEKEIASGSKSSIASEFSSESDWLERSLNLVLVRAGYRTFIESGAAASPSSKASTQASAKFLPAHLAGLATQPNSFVCAQGTVRDLLRCSARLTRMVQDGDYTETLHPTTGAAMLNLVLMEDDPKYSDHAFLVQVFRWFTSPVLRSFLNYAKAPLVWRQEKVARARVENIASIQQEHSRLLDDLDSERKHKLNMLRDLQETHKLRVINDLEAQMERDIAAIRAAHLQNVTLEVAKIQNEFQHMETELQAHYAQEQKEMKTMQQRVEQRRTQQLQTELKNYITRRQEVLENSTLPKLCLFAHDLEATDLFDDCVEIIAFHLPTFVHQPEFLCPILHPGTHRLLFSHAAMADLKLIALAQGLSVDQIDNTVEKALSSNQIIDEMTDPAQPTVVEAKQIAAHFQHLLATVEASHKGSDAGTEENTNAHTSDESLNVALTKLSDKVAEGILLSEDDLSALEVEIMHLLEFRSNVGSEVHASLTNTADVQVLLSILAEMRIREYARDELRQRASMVHQVIMHSVAARQEEEAKMDEHMHQMMDENGVTAAAKLRASHQEQQAYNVQKIIEQITKAYKGKGSIEATASLAQLKNHNFKRLVVNVSRADLKRAVTIETRKKAKKSRVGAEKKAEEAKTSSDASQAIVPFTSGGVVEATPAAMKSNRSLIALALFKEMVRRVIANLRLTAGWVETHPSSSGRTQFPAALMLDHNNRRISVTKPFRYGTLHSQLSFSRISDATSAIERLKHRWFFEVEIGPMDEGCGQCLIGFDIDPVDEDMERETAHAVKSGMPRTTGLKSAQLMRKEHEEQLAAFERLQFDRFARALPMLAAATSASGVTNKGTGASEALAKYIGSMLHAANEKAASAQAAVQLQLLAAQSSQMKSGVGRPILARDMSAAISAAGTAAAQQVLQFAPPAQLATHPAHSSPAQLTASLLAQSQPVDPISPFQMFPSTAYQLQSLSAPPPTRLTQRASGVLWQNDGIIYAHGQCYQVGIGYTEGDVIGVGVDLGTHTFYFVKNGEVFMASPNHAQLDRPFEMEESESSGGNGRGVLKHKKRGPVMGDAKFLHKAGNQPHGIYQSHKRMDSDGGWSDKEGSDDSSARGGRTSPSKKIRLPVKQTSKISKEKRQAKLDRAIAASAAAGTQVSLIDTSPSESTSNSPRSSTVSSTTGPGNLAILKSPLHSLEAAASMEPLEKVEVANQELQKRLNLTHGANPIELPKPMAAAAPMSDSIGSIGALRPRTSLSPIASNSTAAPAPGMPRRQRSAGLFSSSASNIAAIQQAQQLQLERQLAHVSSMQTAAAEALANAEQVYHENQIKSDLLNAAIRAQTTPNAPVYGEILELKQTLHQTVTIRNSAVMYPDLTDAAGLPRVSRRTRRRIRSAALQSPHSTVMTAVGESATFELGEEEDSEDVSSSESDSGGINAMTVNGYIEYSSASALHASSLLSPDQSLSPSVISVQSFPSTPLYYARRFGVPLLLPAPKLHIPCLLSTQQLAQVFASGVSTLASSDSMSKSLQTMLHTSHHILMLNQSLVRQALTESRQIGSPKAGKSNLSDATSSQQARAASVDFDIDSTSSATTALVNAQPLGPPNRAQLQRMDLTGRPSSPSASHVPLSLVTNTQGSAPIANLARVANVARDRMVTSVADDSISPNQANSLVQGRANYTLRPCICLYSSKPLPAVNRQVENQSYASKLRESGVTGPKTSVTVNFEGPFLFPIEGFRAAKNAV